MAVRFDIPAPKPIPRIDRPARFLALKVAAVITFLAAGLVAFGAAFWRAAAPAPAAPPVVAGPAAVPPFEPPPNSFPVPIRISHGTRFLLPGARGDLVTYAPGKGWLAAPSSVHVRCVTALAANYQGRGGEPWIILAYFRLTEEEQTEVECALTVSDALDWRPRTPGVED